MVAVADWGAGGGGGALQEHPLLEEALCPVTRNAERKACAQETHGATA